MSEQDFFKEQLKSLRDSSIKNDFNSCTELISVLNDYFDIPRKPFLISKLYINVILQQ